MNQMGQLKSGFATCAQGHDLTVEDAYLYSANGVRECRLCATANGTMKAKKRVRFDMH